MFRICFIDDDEEFEIPLFLDVFGEVFDIVTASDYAGLKSELESRSDWKPDLFVLDMYFPSGQSDQEAIKELQAEPLSLENDNAEIRQAYINHVRAKNRLAGVLEAWKQNADGGLKLAETVAADYPEVPIVFYSRKATVKDVIRCLTAKNVRAVERKPTGKDDEDTIELTKSAKQNIIHRFETAISKTDPEKLERKKIAAKVILEMLEDFD